MKVCVIGSGPSGLTTIKQLLDEGHDVTCFEKGAGIGGIWFRHSQDADEMKAYDNLVLTVSMKLMSYSDFMYEGTRDFYTHKQYLEYLRAYAKKFNLGACVQLETDVNEVKQIEGNKWRVTTTSKKAGRVEHVFDAVAVCTGPFQRPNKKVAGIENFTGEVVHSQAYRNNERFKGKRVLVVGLAESGADILTEISNVAWACTLSVRSRSFLLPRVHSGIYATDAGTTRAHHWEIFKRATKVPYTMKSVFGDRWYSRAAFHAATVGYGAANVLGRVAQRVVRGKEPPPAKNPLGNPVEPKQFDVDTEWTAEHLEAIDDWNRRSHDFKGCWTPKIIFSKNVTFIRNIVNGKITVNDGGVERMQGSRVYFKDGSSQEFDTIVLCTGFEKDFSRVGQDLALPDNNVRHLYKHAFYPQYGGRLALIGLTRPFTGGIPICSEMQARYFALLCSGKLELPKDVHERIRADKEWEETFTERSPRHTEAIPSQVLYIDSLAREIGCVMPLSQLLMKPQVLVRMWFYPFNQAYYRLVGPHAMPEVAMRELLTDKPGPMNNPKSQAAMMLLSLLPHRIHPKDMVGTAPGEPNPPRKGTAPSARRDQPKPAVANGAPPARERAPQVV